MEMASAPEQVSFEPAPANCWGTIRLDYPKMRSGVHYCEVCKLSIVSSQQSNIPSTEIPFPTSQLLICAFSLYTSLWRMSLLINIWTTPGN